MSVLRRRPRVLLVGVFGLLGLAATAPGQTVVVTARSVKDLADDLEYLFKDGALQDRPSGRVVLGLVEQVRSGELVKGVDLGRVFGLAMSAPRDFPQGGPPSIVAAVPVSDFGQFLDSLKKQGVAVNDQPGVAGFSHTVTAPSGSPMIFMLESRGYALFSLTSTGAEKLRTLDPTTWRLQARPRANLSGQFKLSEIPQGVKDQVFNDMRADPQMQKARQPGENDARYTGRLAGQKFGEEMVKRLYEDGDTLSLDLGVDRKTSRVVLESMLTARPGTIMATSLRNLVAKQSRFAGLAPDATLAAWARVPLPKVIQDAMSQIFDAGLANGLKKTDTPSAKKLLTRTTELMKSNLNAPEIDLGLAIRPAASSGPGGVPFAIDFGVTLTDGRAAERLVRDVIAEENPVNDWKVAFDVARTANGTAIHQMTRVPRDNDPDEARHLGNASLSFAFSENTLMGSFGGDSVPLLRRFIEARVSPPAAAPESAAAIGATAHVAGLGKLTDREQDRKFIQRAAADTLDGEDANRDRVSLKLNGDGDGIRLHLAIDAPALRLLIRLREPRGVED